MITLRELSKGDIQYVNNWRNKKELVDYLGTNFRYINIETDENWFENYMKNRSTQVRCVIIDQNANEILGLIYLLNIDQLNRSAEFAIMIGESMNRNKGVGTSASKLMIQHGFRDLNLNRIYLYVLEDNERAISLYEKIGFQKEGVLQESIYKNGQYRNLILMAILKRHFL